MAESPWGSPSGSAPEMIVMVASLLLCQISFSTGRTNVLNGAAHMALFLAYLMTIFA